MSGRFAVRAKILNPSDVKCVCGDRMNYVAPRKSHLEPLPAGTKHLLCPTCGASQKEPPLR